MRPRERKQPIDRPLAGRVAFEKNASPPLRSGLLSNVPPSFAPPSLRYGGAFVLRASNFADLSAKFLPKWRATSDKTADRPGRGPLRMLLSLRLTPMGGCRIGYASIQICALLLLVRLGPPCRRPILNATFATIRETAGLFALIHGARKIPVRQSNQSDYCKVKHQR
jgi:hypothetical protein